MSTLPNFVDYYDRFADGRAAFTFLSLCLLLSTKRATGGLGDRDPGLPTSRVLGHAAVLTSFRPNLSFLPTSFPGEFLLTMVIPAPLLLGCNEAGVDRRQDASPPGQKQRRRERATCF